MKDRERIAEETLYERLTEDFVEPAANLYMTNENRELFYALWKQFEKALAGYTRQPVQNPDKCAYCDRRPDAAMLVMGNSMAHDKCVVRKLNELLDPDYDGVGEPRQAIGYTRQPDDEPDWAGARHLNLENQPEPADKVEGIKEILREFRQYLYNTEFAPEPFDGEPADPAMLNEIFPEKIIKLFPEYEPEELEALTFNKDEVLGLIPAQAILDFDRAKEVLEKVSQATIRKNQKGQLYRVKTPSL